MTQSLVPLLAAAAAVAVAVAVAIGACVTGAVPRNDGGAARVSAAAAELGLAKLCAAYGGLPQGWPQDGHAGMVQVAGGRFVPGGRDGYPEERPAGETSVSSFWMDRTEVTNAQFARFVQETGYVTETERGGGGAVFRPPAEGAADEAPEHWWQFVQGANWQHPEGPGSTIEGRANQPVVQVSQADAMAYAHWLGRDLPTETQWEFAARAHGQGERIDRGPRDETGRPSANFWQGSFPYLNLSEDGYAERAPVGCFHANGLGLHDMIGNVWEWTRDPWIATRTAPVPGTPVVPRVSTASAVIKGGSFLCSPDFCARYRETARVPQDVAMGAVHVGFRTVSAR